METAPQAPSGWRADPRYCALSGFRKAVYELTAAIPAGRVTSYGEIAKSLHCASSQAVGTALKNNPFAPCVPCHRVIKGGGSIGGFNGATEECGSEEISRKIKILAEEGVRFDAARRLVDPTSAFTDDDFAPAAVAEALRLYGPPGDASTTPPRGVGAAQGQLAGSKRGRAAPESAELVGRRRITRGPQSAAAALLPAADASLLRAELGRVGATGAAVRSAARSGALRGHTSGLAPGFAQANLVMVPRDAALEFLLFCSRNPKPCPVLEVLDPGCWEARTVAPGSDVRRDLPRYRVWRHGELADEVDDVSHLWAHQRGGGAAAAASPRVPAAHPDARSDWVTFLLGCSFSFEDALQRAGLPVRHLQEEKGGRPVDAGSPPPPVAHAAADAKNVPMFTTALECASAGAFRGPLVVSMRPMTPAQAVVADRVTAAFPRVHGRPVHAGSAAALGIADLGRPDYGDPVTVHTGEVPVFWACGVTPQAALLRARLPLAITHAPGHMFVSDLRNEDLAGPATELPRLPGSVLQASVG